MTRSLRLATFLMAVGLARVAGATTFVAMSERVLARAADAIVLGTVTARDTVGTADGGIYTLVTLSIEGRYKGDVGATLVLKEPGGDLDDRGLVIPGAPVFTLGQRSVLFLSAARDGSAHTTALGLGQYRVDDTVGDEAVAERSVSEPVLGGSRVRRLKVSRLLRTIAKAVRSDRRVPNALLAAPAEATATDVARPTIGAFTLMDSPAGRWHEADLGQTVVYGVDSAGDPSLGPDASNAAMDAALAAWSTVDGATIRLARGGAVDLAPLICDGVSQIIFGDPFDEMPKPQSCGGVLALGGYCTKGRGASESDVVNGTKFRRIAEGNVTFNKGFGGCSFWNATNLAEVATHEIGHTIGLGHSSERDDEPQPSLKDATMYYRAHFDGRGASLRPDDVAAARFIYPGTPGASATDDADGDGIPDASDNCPGSDPELGLANPGQVDTDGDGMGDLCDGCPLIGSTAGAFCQAILGSTIKVTESDVLWRGTVALPADVDASPLRIVLTTGAGVLIDTANMPAGVRATGRKRHLRYRSEGVSITVKRGRNGTAAVRATFRDVVGDGAMPVISASLQLGSNVFSATLSCPPRGSRRFTCRG